MAANNRRAEPGDAVGQAVVAAVGAGLVAVALVVVNVAVRLGGRLAGAGAPLDGNPLAPVVGLIKGTTAWPGAAGWWLVGAQGALLAGLAAGAAALAARRRGRRSRIDWAGRYLGSGADIRPLTRPAAAATARRLGVQGDRPGVPLGRTVAGGVPVFSSWEDMVTVVAGPRTGKTTSYVVPAIMEAPGAVLTTSNKRDVLDATREPRGRAGPVWVFDPQGVAGEPASWWFPVLSYVRDEVRADKLAALFAAATSKADAARDAYFEPAGQDVLSCVFLAAALGGRPVSQAYRWLTSPADRTPVELLRDAGLSIKADQLRGYATLTEKQRDGVYGTALKMAAPLTYRKILEWVEPLGPDDDRPRFDPAEFVAGTGTLYSLSKEGQGSAGALVAALTVATVEAGEERATRSPGGRLAVPLLSVLDEAANVCRWRDLPDLYSHFGSRGEPIITLLQSYSQGVEVWGRDGMEKLWSSSNVKLYLGGVAVGDFLRNLADEVGEYDKATSSVSSGDGRRQVSQQLRRERILDPAELAAFPRGRALVLASGCRPTLLRTVPWMDKPYAGDVRESVETWTPKGQAAAAGTAAPAGRAGAAGGAAPAGTPRVEDDVAPAPAGAGTKE